MREGKIITKTKGEIKIMTEGGKKLGLIKKRLSEEVRESVSASQIENLADKLIKKAGGRASFKMVQGYSWATCINVNEGIVHGIPKDEVIFKKGDVVSIDVGLYYKGFHTDTSFTVGIEVDKKKQKFLSVGKETLNLAINQAQVGNRIFDISKVIEDNLNKGGLTPIRVLVGHGIGRELHESPQIPCFTSGMRKESIKIPEGAVLAIEVIYCRGKADVKLAKDGWTIKTKDGKISGLFEDTIVVSKNGPKVLTESDSVLAH